jgi:hypothetical protein
VRIRTGYSFHSAFGHVKDVGGRLNEIGWSCFPISDRDSTFGFVSATKIAKATGLRPVYGAELGVARALGDKPRVDHWTFFAINSLRSLNELVTEATSNRGKNKKPCLTLADALSAKDVVKIVGETDNLDNIDPETPRLFVSLSPGTPIGMFKKATKLGFSFVAQSDNRYPTIADREVYRVALGFRADTRAYPQHVMSDDEWRESVAHLPGVDSAIDQAVSNRNACLSFCKAEMRQATLFSPVKEKTLRQMCVDGAKMLGVDLKDHVYAERLDRELNLIDDKKFEDYFYILADIIGWARQRMIVGPARGSSCGSLVCYLTGITTIDPIPYGLLFERFIDKSRPDLPDIDVDFSDVSREKVFAYAEEKFGQEFVAKLGNVNSFQPRSALNQIGIGLKIPQWLISRVAEGAVKRAQGDSRAAFTIEDTFAATEAGKQMLAEYPESVMAAKLEDHPSAAGRHAAGIVITKEPINEFVAISGDSRTTMCDKKDAEALNLLKIDALGLTQLSIFERTLEQIGVPPVSGWLEKNVPLDDPMAFDVINQKKYNGIFQFIGSTVQSLAQEMVLEKFDDVVAITALARPGPIGSGQADTWLKRRTGKESVTFPHPLFETALAKTYGIFVYQEQVMKICREVGDLSWDEVNALRRAMSKSLGQEFFDQYGNKFKKGAVEKGVPKATVDRVWEELCQYGAMCLSGDTVLINPHPNQNKRKKFTLKELFECGGKLNGQKPKKQKLFSMQDGTINPNSIVNVFSSGKRETWLVEVDSGEKIRATMEHRFFCPDGQYRQLKNIASGSAVMMMGQTRLPPSRSMKKKGRGGQNWWPKFKAGEPLLKRQIAKLKKIYKRCQVCKIAPYQHVHHIDKDRTNNSFDNLLPVCVKCHRKIHGKWTRIGKSARIAHVVSVSDPKIEDTYDVAMKAPHHNFVANGFVVHNSFNESHSVAYGLVSYWSMWLKARYPLEFAAATLEFEDDPDKQIPLLRELKKEGVAYVSVDVDKSTDRWQVDRENSRLIGPLTNIDGFGVKTVSEIMSCRSRGIPLRPAILKRLDAAKTSIDSLYPVQDRVSQLYPDLRAANIVTEPTSIINVQPEDKRPVVIIGVAKKINHSDENNPLKIAKRGGKVYSGPHIALNLFIQDDTDEILCRVFRWDYEKIGKEVFERGRAGKAIYAIKGSIPDWASFRMIQIDQIKYIGDMVEDGRRIENAVPSQPAEA